VQAVVRMHGAELMLADNRPGLAVSLGFRSRARNSVAA